MAKKKSKFKEVVETVESWVGIGPKAKKTAKKAANKKAAKNSSAKTAKKGNKAAKKTPTRK